MCIQLLNQPPGHSTALQAAVRHLETLGCPRRWNEKCYLKTHCIFILQMNSSNATSLFEKETILCIPYKKPQRRKAEAYA